MTMRYILRRKHNNIFNLIFNSNKLHIRRNSNIIRSAILDIEIPRVTIPEFVFQDFNKFPHKIAVECGVTGKKFTFEEIRSKSNNLSKSLRKKLQLQKRDVIAILLPNIPEYPICILGALEALLIVTTINPLYTPEEVKKQLSDCNAKAVITLSSLLVLVQNAIQLSGLSISILSIKSQESESLPKNVLDFREFIDNRCDINDIVPHKDISNDVALLPYSSGTTGLPKGVQLTHFNIVSNLCQMNHPYFKLAHETTTSHQDVVPGVLPWFHIYGLVVVTMNKLKNLCKIISLPKFTPELFVTTLIKHKPHALYISPPTVIFMYNHTSVKKEHLQSVRFILSGAAPLGALDEEQLLAKAERNIDMLQGYGLTETSPTVVTLTSNGKRTHKVSGSIGEVIPNMLLKVVPSNNHLGDPLGPNQQGELLVKGPNVTEGYYNKPEQNKEAYVDGWFRTGDLVYYDDNRMFYIEDRLKDLIKVKGFQVPPAELEEVVRNYPDILDVAVIGIPHETYGEVPRAYVVLKPNAKFVQEKLHDYVSTKLTNFKQLRGGVSIIDSIPKTNTGKILRKKLREVYLNESK